jgi:hypothetical protein
MQRWVDRMKRAAFYFSRRDVLKLRSARTLWPSRKNGLPEMRRAARRALHPTLEARANILKILETIKDTKGLEKQISGQKQMRGHSYFTDSIVVERKINASIARAPHRSLAILCITYSKEI